MSQVFSTLIIICCYTYPIVGIYKCVCYHLYWYDIGILRMSPLKDSYLVQCMVWNQIKIGCIPFNSLQRFVLPAIEVNASQDPFTNWWVVEDGWNIARHARGWSTWWIKLSVLCLRSAWIDLANHMGVVHFTGQKNCHHRRFSAREWYLYVSRLWELSHPKCARGSACISYELLTMDHWIHCSCTKFAHKNLNLLGWPVFPPIWHTPVKAWEGQQRVCAGG